MAKTKKKKETKPKQSQQVSEEPEEEQAGFPKDVDFKKLLGCGG